MILLKLQLKHRKRGEVVSTEGVGVGGAIQIGSQYALAKYGEDCVVVVMAGDGQMDGAIYPSYSTDSRRTRRPRKGNRWLHKDGPRGMPWVRRIGTWWLSRLTSLASGVRVRDSQCGYTATSGTNDCCLGLVKELARLRVSKLVANGSRKERFRD